MSLFEENGDPEYERARKRAMYLLGNQAYSEKNLSEKLAENYSEKTVKKVVSDMKHLGFVNDEDYARRLAGKLIGKKNYGLRRVKLEMKRKGLPDEIIEDALSKFENEDYLDSLVRLIETKYSDKLYDREDRQRTTAALARRGYGFSQIKTAMERVIEDRENKEYEEED